MLQGMSIKPQGNALDYLNKKKDIRSTIKQATAQPMQNIPVYGAGMTLQPGTPSFTNQKPIIQKAITPATPQIQQQTPIVPQETSQNSGFGLIPTAGASYDYLNELEYDIKNGATQDEVLQGYPELKGDIKLINELHYDITNGATQDEIKQAYPELSGIEQQSVKPQENIPGLDIGVKSGEAISKFGKGLKFEAGNELQKSSNPAAQSFGQLIEALKFAGNVPGDALQLVGDLGKAVSQPIETTKSIKALGETAVETVLNYTVLPVAGLVTGKDLGDAGTVYTSEDKKLIKDGVTKSLIDNFGTLEKTQNTIIENPVDVLLAIQGGLNIAKSQIKNPAIIDKLNKVDEAINPINILKTEVGAVKKVASTVAKPITTPAKVIIEQGKTLLGKPGNITGIQQAIRPNIKVKNGKVIRGQDQITREITRADELITKSGVKPKDLQTYRQALETELKGLGKQISEKTKKPLDIDVSDTAGKIRKLASKDAIKLLDEAEANKLMKMADDLEVKGKISVSDAEYMNQFINDQLKSIPGISETSKRGLNILVKDIRAKLDETLSNIPGEFKQIKKDYGALRNILGDTVRREIVYNRQNPEGLITSFSKIEGLGNVGGGVLRILGLDVKGGVSQIGKGLIQNKLGTFIKTKNDPNYIIEQIFSKKGKNVNTPNADIPSTIKNNLGTTGIKQKVKPKSVLSPKEKAKIEALNTKETTKPSILSPREKTLIEAQKTPTKIPKVEKTKPTGIKPKKEAKVEVKEPVKITPKVKTPEPTKTETYIPKSQIEINKNIKEGYKKSAEKRFEQGKFTPTEMQKGYTKLESFYEGRKIKVPGGIGTIVGKPSFGKIKVKLSDDVTKSFNVAELKALQNKITNEDVVNYLKTTEYDGYGLKPKETKKPKITPKQTKNDISNKTNKEVSKTGGEGLKSKEVKKTENKILSNFKKDQKTFIGDNSNITSEQIIGLDKIKNKPILNTKKVLEYSNNNIEKLKTDLLNNPNIKKVDEIIENSKNYKNFHKNNIDNPIKGTDIKLEKELVKYYDRRIKLLEDYKASKTGGKTIKEKLEDGFNKIAEKTGAKINLMENRGNGMSGKKDLSYQGVGTASGKGKSTGITLDKMINKIDGFAENSKKNTKAINVIKDAANNPSKKVTIYRATPGDKINVGDWVFLTKEQADNFSKSIITKTPKPGYKVLSEKINAGDIEWSGKNIEFIKRRKGITKKVVDNDLIKVQENMKNFEKKKLLGTGEPLVVYRGTSKGGVNFYKGKEELPFTYYSLNKDKASQYGNVSEYTFNTSGKTFRGSLNEKFGINANIENIKIIDALKKEGYNSAIIKGDELIVFDKTKIKDLATKPKGITKK